MGKSFTFITTLLGAVLLTTSLAQDSDFIPGEVLVQFRVDATGPQLADAVQRAGLSVKKHLPARGKNRQDSGLVLMRTGRGAEQTIQALRNHPAVEYVEPNHIKTHSALSNDPNYTNGKLWGMYGDASTPANQYGSQAAEAWAAGNTGAHDIYVAVIDQGIDINHPDLAANIGRNPGEIPGNNIDDDQNGYIDDVFGYDFVNNNNTVFDGGRDKDDHGTHVAGTIGAVGGNGSGVAGVAWNVKILSGKFLGPKGGTIADLVEAFEYFIDLKQRHGLNLIAFNASYGGGRSTAEQIAVIRAAKAGILLVAAAGNNAATTALYPAAYDTTLPALDTDGVAVLEPSASYDSVISVTAIDSKGALPSWANRHSTRVDLGAPGDAIISTLPNGRYGSMYGTSMATPHVTGACVLYLNTHRDAFPWDIKAAILSAASATPTPSLAGKTLTGGRLNVSGF